MIVHRKRGNEEGRLAKTRPHERVFALTLAILFLATTIATGVAVVWTIKKDNKQTNQTSITEEGSLKGTQLADFTPIDSVPKLEKIDTVVGTGDTVEAGASVTVHYTGALVKTGVIFESAKDSGQPASFPLSVVISGCTEGVPGMKVGGTRRLIIPAAMAYGSVRAAANIPPNSDLVFDIELTAIA